MTITRPSASTRTDHKAWDEQREREMADEQEARLRGDTPQPKFSGDRHMPDNRLTSIIKVCITIFGGLATLAIWTGVQQMISLDKKVALLLDRPVPVSREQYDRDMEILRTEQRNMRVQLETIQIRQQATISGARP